MQKSNAGYAYGQIRLCLADLASSSHGTKLKAVKRFQDYIAQNKPDLNDDDVMYLFAGSGAVEMQGAVSKVGLLYYAGIDSGKHGGQLKRICAPVIGLIRYLISLPPFGTDNAEYNMFFEIFVTIPVEDLSKINFIKHILGEADKGLIFGGGSRSGGANDALEILSILMRDHRTPEGDPDPVDMTQFLGDNKICRDRLNQYIQKNNSEVVTKAMQQFKVTQTKIVASKWDDSRAVKWEEDNFKKVPIQEGEEGEVQDNDDEIHMAIVPDPLGLSELDLRATQKLFASGRLAVPTAGQGGGGGGGEGGGIATRMRRNSISSVDDEEEDGGGGGTRGGFATASVMPQDKAFSASLFLTLIHGGISFDQLQVGSDNLRLQLEQQNSQRENLVRVHFGLFVNCAEGLDWLKAYRKGIYSNQTEAATAARQAVSISPKDNGEQMLSRAKSALESARNEATDALKPILDRMRKMRKIKTADQVLRRLAPTLENPHKMRLALNRGDLDEVIAIYLKVQSIAPSTALRVVQGVKDSAEAIIDELKQRCRAAMDTPEPEVGVLLRYAKIIAELEGDDSYREQIRQCFASQLRHFNSLIESLMGRFASDAYAAYCHARDLRAEAEADARASSANGNGLGGPRPSKEVPSQIISALDWMPDLFLDDEPRKLSILSSRKHLLGRGEDDDLAWENRSDDSEGDSQGKADLWVASDNEGFEEPTKLNHDMLAFKVRELHLSRLINAISKWLPCLYRLVQEATSKISVGGEGLWIATGDKARARNNVKLALNRKKGPPSMVMLSSSLVACSEAIRFSIVGLGDEMTQGNLASLEQLSGTTSMRNAAFEPLILKQEKMLEINDTKVFQHDSFSQPLKEPFLSRCVRDAGDLFDIMSAIHTQGDAANLKNDELYQKSVGILGELSRGGEVSIAIRLMKKLRERSLELFAKKDQARNKGKDKFSSMELGNMERTAVKLKSLIARHLHRLSLKTRRPEWVSESVRDGLRSTFSAVVDGMQREALLFEDDNSEDARRLVQSTSRSRARTVTVSALQSPELLRLEAELKHGQVSESARGDYLLDLLRACAILRTDAIPSLWKEVKKSFPTPTEIGSSLPFFSTTSNGSASLFIDGFKSPRVGGGGAVLAMLGSSDLFNRIMKTVGFETPEANINIEELVRLESTTVTKYVACKLQGLRVVSMAGYVVLTKRETAGAWREMGMRPDGFIVPPHLSRLLIMLGGEKSTLGNLLRNLTIDYGMVEGAVKGEKYQDHIFKDICQGFIEIYAELVARVNSNFLASDDNNPLPSSVKTDLISVLTGSTSALCQHPRAYGQATEELAYLLTIIRPFVRSSSLPPPFNRHSPVGSGEEFLSASELGKEAVIFTMAINR